MEIEYKPIGVVVRGLDEGVRGCSRYQVVSEIMVYSEYVEGLRGLDEYSHILVVYHLDRVDGYRLVTRPWNRMDMPLVGVFATRFPYRPNPIGVSTVELLDIDGSIIRVRGLDAWTGSPVLDIKPYDYLDIVRKPRIPSWSLKRWLEGGDRPDWLGPCEED